MRPIKFRALNKNKEMVRVDHLLFDSPENGFSVYGCADKKQFPNEGVIDYLGSNSKIPTMQFTGLLDKNGKEIYEGDVVKVSQGWYKPDTDPNHSQADNPEHTEYVNYSVQYERCQWTKLSWGQLYFKPCMTKAEYKLIKSKPFQEWYSNRWFIEVIGNIYENPELLTSQQ